jgi:hypothetical protein
MELHTLSADYGRSTDGSTFKIGDHKYLICKARRIQERKRYRRYLDRHSANPTRDGRKRLYKVALQRMNYNLTLWTQ